MYAVVSRAVLALIAIASTPVAYVLLFVSIERTWLRADHEALWVTSILTGLVLIVAWILVWRQHVIGTGDRVRMTAAAVIWSSVPAFLIGAWVESLSGWSRGGGPVFGGAVWALCWLASTALIWRERPGERSDSIAPDIRCTACGYSMNGLREARCPECGRQSTLDELLTAAWQRRGGVLADNHEARANRVTTAAASRPLEASRA